MRHYWLLTLGLLIALVNQSSGELLPIINPGFELISRPLSVGENSNGSGGAGVLVATKPELFGTPQIDDPVEIPGWRTFMTGDPLLTVHAGILNPPFDQQGQPFITGYSGNYVAALQHHQMQQTIQTQIEPNTRYRLTFLSGSGLWYPGDGAYVALLAAPDASSLAFFGSPGVTTLALNNTHPPFGTEGQMLPYELEYTTPSSLPANLENHYLAISFFGSDGIPLMNFDDFALEAFSLFPACDFDGDGACDIVDLNSLLAIGPIAGGISSVGNEQFDLTEDGVIDLADRDAWLDTAAVENGLASPYLVADANLDGVVDGLDFIAWNGHRFSGSLVWDHGDFNGDGVVDGQDFIIWNGNKFMSSSTTVPEPSTGWFLLTGVLWAGFRRLS